ncbi:MULTISPECIES: leucine-rich repeat domain-containing protein [Symbiopectobacterium]|uniref:leucine-rich repeat domain-containing protein n=1 Tax=Symbiopectobacterium TaxID=801 RepID=UPI001A1E29A3|nr:MULTISPECIES: leucine-rich repeat domain-containing protein [Symbiopectobacterium]MBG6248068.1 hypothetical protein [Candidatus Symbiopectobacterium sp. PLON1]MBT9429408.1 hypothetical protein [Candidatus Symbiopectobacterium endolongispinus]
MLTIKNESVLYSKSLTDTTPAIAISSQTTTSEQSELEYYEIWSEWEKNSSQGMGEQRDVAVGRMRDSLERKTDSLDLSMPNLSSLPGVIPKQVKTLDISRNQLHTLTERL